MVKNRKTVRVNVAKCKGRLPGTNDFTEVIHHVLTKGSSNPLILSTQVFKGDGFDRIVSLFWPGALNW